MTSGLFSLELDPSRSGEAAAAHPFLAGPENDLLRLFSTAENSDSVAPAAAEVLPLNLPSPLVFFGPTQTGKTHLVLGLLNRWRAAQEARGEQAAKPLVWSGADFARAYAHAVDADSLADFRERCQEASWLVIDNAWVLAEKRHAQHELVLLLDSRAALQRPCLITLPVSPENWNAFSPGLASRLRGGLVIPVATPEAATRRVMLAGLLAERGLALPSAAINELATAAQTYAELEGMLVSLVARATAQRCACDEVMVRQFLTERSAGKRLSIRDVAVVVARHFRTKLGALRGPSQARSIVLPRSVAMFLAREFTGHSLAAIGKEFGRRDHTTVLHACQKIDELLPHDETMQGTVAHLRRLLAAAKPPGSRARHV